ncbi:MAG: hypothetical protein NWE79_00755 [Candidatus Bathyarchaeota archaeon]|nr:hypothetical protein [Candidatus Bathyarchaeota archaeon]
MEPLAETILVLGVAKGLLDLFMVVAAVAFVAIVTACAAAILSYQDTYPGPGATRPLKIFVRALVALDVFMATLVLVMVVENYMQR